MRTDHLAYSADQAEQILRQAGEMAVERARHAYDQGILDPMTLAAGLGPERPSASFIDYCIRSEEGLGWQGALAPHGYRYNGDDFEWCGAFVAYCMPWIDLRLRVLYWSSTDRLNAYAQHRMLFGSTRERVTMAEIPRRTREDIEALGRDWTPAYTRQFGKFDENSELAPIGIRAGDICLLGPAERRTNFRDFGDHVTLLDRYEAESKTLVCYEGNAKGVIPGRPETLKKPAQGVVHMRRQLGLRPDDSASTYHLRRWIRPSFFDLDLKLFVKFGGTLP